jgi:hypothetical protein
MFSCSICTLWQPEKRQMRLCAAIIRIFTCFWRVFSKDSQSGQDSQDRKESMAARTWRPEHDDQNMTAWIGKLGQDKSGRQPGQLQPEQDNGDKTTGAGQLSQGSPNRTAGTGQNIIPWWSQHGSKDRTGGTGELETRVLGQGSWDLPVGIGLDRTAAEDSQEEKKKTERPEHGGKGRTAGTGQPGRDIWDRPYRTYQSGQVAPTGQPGWDREDRRREHDNKDRLRTFGTHPCPCPGPCSCPGPCLCPGHVHFHGPILNVDGSMNMSTSVFGVVTHDKIFFKSILRNIVYCFR